MRLTHLLNTYSPISVHMGTVTDVRDGHPKNAFIPR